MTRKHYRELASVIYAAGLNAQSDETRETVSTMAREIALICKRDNSNFDFGRFYAACGVTV